MQKVLITGSNGLLGQTLINRLVSRYEVVGLSRGANRNLNKASYQYIDIDLLDFSRLRELLSDMNPDYIINTAAMTHVDQCEEHQDTCDLINVELVKRLVDYCATTTTHLVHISTDFIFDGENGPYREDDTPNPLNYYGWSKLKSEQVVLASSIPYTILRTILVYGYVPGLNKNNIVLWIRDQVTQGKEVTIIDDQYRMPTLVDDLAEACELAIKKSATGIFNVSSNSLLSIYEMAEQVAEEFDLDKALIKKISTEQLNQRAKRPARTGFVLEKSKKELGLPSHSFKERLQFFKNQLDKLETPH